MKRFGWRWLVISSLLLAVALAEVRPRYGGTLHVALRAAPVSLDPVELAGTLDSFGGRDLVYVLFDTLVSIDDSGRVQPALAESWQSSRNNQRWELHIRQGVKFHDGTVLTGDIAATSLRVSNPTWNIAADGNTVIVHAETAESEMLAQLALPRNAIARRDKQGIGTGPFQVVDWQPGKSLTLAANEDCWRGRPFLDGLQIEGARSFRDQTSEFALHRADLIEVAPEQAHHIAQEGRALTSSARMELLALVFSKEPSSNDEKLLRQALALSVERGSIRSVLLQGAGEPTGSLIPTSISGYGFVFPAGTDLKKARQIRGEVKNTPSWSIGYDGSDPLSRVLAERIALNAKDAGLQLRPSTAADADLRISRIPIASGNPFVAFVEVLSAIGLTAQKSGGGSLEELYAAEQAIVNNGRVIPLFHLSATYASIQALKDWSVRVDGSWNLDRAWLETSKR